MSDEIQENKINIDQAIGLLTSVNHEIAACWNSFIKEEYNNDYPKKRDDLVDIITLVDFIVEKFKEERTGDFKAFFEVVEQILEKGDENAQELVVVGILEGLQNNCGLENLNYHTGFNQWMKPLTQNAWDSLIYLWESNDSIEEKQEKLKGFKI